MKKLIMLFAAIVMVAGFSTSVMAEDTENTAVGAKILAALTIAETAPMHFGTMTVPTTIAKVVLAPAGTVTVGEGTITLLAQTPTPTAAAYSVAGDASTIYDITFGATSIDISHATELDVMTVNEFVSSKGVTNQGTLDGAGTDNFTVGATLNLAVDQLAGTYAGTFDVTVAYN